MCADQIQQKSWTTRQSLLKQQINSLYSILSNKFVPKQYLNNSYT